jgi:hypothetical protein
MRCILRLCTNGFCVAAASRLANTASAVAVLRVVNVQNFPAASCRPVTAAAFRVYPPNQTASRTVPFPFGSCSRSGPVFLFVRAVQKA